MNTVSMSLDATLGGLQAAILSAMDRYAITPCGFTPPVTSSTTNSMQPEYLEWFSAAPLALQGIASSMLASYATVTRARAGMPNRGAPSAATTVTPGGASSSSGAILRTLAAEPTGRVGPLRASPERAFRS